MGVLALLLCHGRNHSDPSHVKSGFLVISTQQPGLPSPPLSITPHAAFPLQQEAARAAHQPPSQTAAAFTSQTSLHAEKLVIPLRNVNPCCRSPSTRQQGFLVLQSLRFPSRELGQPFGKAAPSSRSRPAHPARCSSSTSKQCHVPGINKAA